ncbi:mesaconyl-C4 hydratase [Fusarium circinatum]|uniref:Mesaconyl-C4 hydratase n=1 Tax=Fusarium circinatum TaxID=48490 RepID=A0A8H5UBZ2_FUSCI|nr:mesaconyl-C4 hydratase [Fusarium circinatum]
MRPLSILNRYCGPAFHRAYTTKASSSIASSLKAHPPKIIADYLTPMPSHLLTTTIDDLLYPLPTESKISSPPRALPQGHHLVYFPIQLPPSRLIPDGADPDHSPGPPYTRRVWAGGEVIFRGDGMKLDARPAICQETIEDVTLRGKEGEEKVFVDVWRKYGTGHEVEGRTEWDIEERRTLVFMRDEEGSASSPSPSPSPPRLLKCKVSSYQTPGSSLLTPISDPQPPKYSTSLTPSPIHLFHFSALSFNAHSIHFDPQFAREVDGHRALLVHGPFTLALMLRFLNDRVGAGVAVYKFSYRNYAPLYVNERMTINIRKVSKEDGAEGRWDVWIEGPEGGMAVKGTAEVVSK